MLETKLLLVSQDEEKLETNQLSNILSSIWELIVTLKNLQYYFPRMQDNVTSCIANTNSPASRLE